ncbi:MAG TPA: sulfotransferase, partial [Rhizobiaceae bacterium]|nr:sulfotransferase [Rhizobiaceae bacterium]
MVLVCGAQRSGTTLVQTILANALSSPLLPEAHVLCATVETCFDALADWNKNSAFYKDEADCVAQFRTMFQSQVQHLCDLKSRPDYLVLKDPNFVRYLPILPDLVDSSAATVAVVRDPRDIAASFMKIGQRQIASRETTKYTKRDIGFICGKINDSCQHLLRPLPVRTQVVRYEDFVYDPARELTRLAAHFGWQVADMGRTLEHPQWLEPSKRHKASWITELEDGAVSTASVGNFAGLLTRDELAAVERNCAEILSSFNYLV